MLLVDAENVRRSIWPNVTPTELVVLCEALTATRDDDVVIVFDGPPPGLAVSAGVRLVGEAGRSADDVIAELAGATGADVEVATSDRGLRDRLPTGTALVGGGTFVRMLLGRASAGERAPDGP